jgi:hypothetical protein
MQWTSPVGTLRYPNLDAPRAFKGADGIEGKPKYDTGITFEPKVLKAVKAQMEEIARKLGGLDADDHPKLPLAKDKKTREEYFKAHAGEKFKPVLVDAKANDLPPSVNPRGGTKARLSCTLEWYEGFGGGLTAYLNGVQIVELVERNAKVSFGELEGGYVYEGGEDETKPGFEPVSAEEMADF